MTLRLACALAVLPGAALACALPPSIVMTLPTGLAIAGAGLTVAATALLGGATASLPAMGAVVLWRRRWTLPDGVTSHLAFLGALALIAVGFLGPTDPMHNLLTLAVWSGLWVALPMASLLLGNLWHVVNPWRGPVRGLRAALGMSRRIGLARLGHWPAVAGLGAFLWFELVSTAPDDPATLAAAALAYFALILILGVLEGEDWLDRGEFLTVYLGLLARIAPLWLDRRTGRMMAGWPGTQVLAMPPLAAGGFAFVTLALAGLTFDGLSGTFWWLGLTGQNPLEFAGRSAVVGVNTAGLLAVWALTAASIAGALALGRRIGGRADPAQALLAFLAIAAGYHAAHMLVILLTTGQYALFALNDPLFRGDALLGLPPFFVSFGFLADRAAMTAVWTAQVALILGAHLLAVLLALKIAARGGPSRAAGHLPMTALMVGYTVLGLWLLSSPAGA